MDEEDMQSNNEDEEEMSTDELAYDNHLAISGLVELLIAKGLINEDEYQAKLAQLDPDDDGDEEGDGDEDDGDDDEVPQPGPEPPVPGFTANQ